MLHNNTKRPSDLSINERLGGFSCCKDMGFFPFRKRNNMAKLSSSPPQLNLTIIRGEFPNTVADISKFHNNKQSKENLLKYLVISCNRVFLFGKKICSA